jgi:hypothetical protein
VGVCLHELHWLLLGFVDPESFVRIDLLLEVISKYKLGKFMEFTFHNSYSILELVLSTVIFWTVFSCWCKCCSTKAISLLGWSHRCKNYTVLSKYPYLKWQWIPFVRRYFLPPYHCQNLYRACFLWCVFCLLCLRPVAGVLNVASVSGLSILGLRFRFPLTFIYIREEIPGV